MKALRWSLGILGAVVLLLGVALFIATQVINPDDYRGELARIVSRDTGRPFRIEGHLALSWYPWLTLRIGAARLGNPAHEPGPDLLAWRSAVIPLRLLPLLLHRRLELGTIEITGADIHLWRSAAGTGNWQPLLAGRPTTGAPTGAPPSIGGLVLRDASLEYTATRGTVRLTHGQLRLSAWQPGRPFTLATRFVLHTPQLPAAGIPVRFAARQLGVQAHPLGLQVPHWSLSAASAALSGSLQVSDSNARPDGSGALRVQIPSLRRLIGRLGLKMHLPKNPAVLERLKLSAHWALQAGAVRIEPLRARLDATTLTGWVARSGGPAARWTFNLAADRIDLSRYLPPSRKHAKPLKLPLALLRRLHARGTLTVHRARFGTTTLRDARLHVQ